MALEVKNSGAYGEQAVQRIRECFTQVRRLHPRMACDYVTMAEHRGYKWAVTDETLGFPAYTLFWRDGRRTYTPSGD